MKNLLPGLSMVNGWHLYLMPQEGKKKLSNEAYYTLSGFSSISPICFGKTFPKQKGPIVIGLLLELSLFI